MNPLLAPYIGEKCPQCDKTFESAESLQGTKFGADARPVHSACWDAYTGEMVQQMRAICESIWMHNERDGEVYRATLTKEDMIRISRWVRPARNH